MATSAKIISFETNCCKLQNPTLIKHLVQTWILRVPGSLPLIPWLKFMRKEELFGFSVLSRGCLQVLGHLSLPFCLPLGVCAFLSLILQPCVDLTDICPLHQFSRTVHQESFSQQALTRCSPGTRPFSRKTGVSGAKSRSHSLGHSHQEASKIRHTHTLTGTNKNHSRRTMCHVLLTCIQL